MSDCTVKQATILLADDEEFLRKLTEEVLVERGYYVLAAASAFEALEMAGRHNGDIDLLLADMRMPDMDGMELATEIRRLYPFSKVVFMTAYLPSEAQEMAPNEEILSKPFCIDALCASIHQQLNQE